MKSKTIILSSQKKFENNSPRAILTLISNKDNLEGKIRLYNLNYLPKKSKLGIYYNETVYSAELYIKDNCYNFKIDENINLDKDIYCAIIDKENKNDVVLCGGNNTGFVFETVDEDNNQDNSENIETSNCENCDCETCVYKKYFYEHYQPKQEETTNENKEEIEKIDTTIQSSQIETSLNDKEELFDMEKQKQEVETQKQEKDKFLDHITNQLDDMFKTYPEDESIMKIIPNSKIVKVEDGIDDNSYIIGVIYEDNEIRYLLYGVPAKYNDNPPTEFGENYQWLPLNTEDPMSDGYFLLYQDCIDGKIVPIKVE